MPFGNERLLKKEGDALILGQAISGVNVHLAALRKRTIRVTPILSSGESAGVDVLEAQDEFRSLSQAGQEGLMDDSPLRVLLSVRLHL